MKNEILTERVNLFEPNDYIFFCVELCGNFTADMLSKAVRAAFEANESTMSKIVLTDSGNAYYERISESRCTVEIIEAANESVWDIARENEKQPFDLESGELMRCFIIPQKSGFSLLIMSHHLAGDGKAICFFIEDIMYALSGKELDFKPLILITKNNIPKENNASWLLAKLYTEYCGRKWHKLQVPAFGWSDYYKLHESYWRSTGSLFLHKTLSEEETKCVTANARNIGVSVNSYIITAFLCANKNIRVTGLPVSVRDRGNCSMSNHTSGISAEYSYSDNLSFPDNARKLHAIIMGVLKKHRYFVLQFLSRMPATLIDSVLLYTHGLFDIPFTRKTASIMGYTNAKKRDLGVTNLTVIDLPAVYENVQIKGLIFMPPNVSYSNNIIGVSTFDGNMTLTYHGTDKGIEDQTDFFNRGVETLLFKYRP